MTYMPTYYEILGLPEALRGDPNLSVQTIRNAYRRALLRNHPDKSANPNLLETRFSIDQISGAFSTLSDRKLRAEYDRGLKEDSAQYERGFKGREVFRTGIEIVDLDDLETDESQSTWYKSCRCGDERGFLIREADLEEAVEDSEICVGCRGCSLWLKVLFGVVEGAPPSKADDNLGSTGEKVVGIFSSSA